LVAFCFFEELLSVLGTVGAPTPLLASFTGFSDAFATFLSFLLASLSETSNLFAGFASEPPLAIVLVFFAFLTWAGIRPSVVVESVGVLDFFALIGAASSLAVIYC
jgi:hypothetical protein